MKLLVVFLFAISSITYCETGINRYSVSLKNNQSFKGYLVGFGDSTLLMWPHKFAINNENYPDNAKWIDVSEILSIQKKTVRKGWIKGAILGFTFGMQQALMVGDFHKGSGYIILFSPLLATVVSIPTMICGWILDGVWRSRETWSIGGSQDKYTEIKEKLRRKHS